MQTKTGSGKPAIIWSETLSSWGSCRTIVPNLKAAYDGLGWRGARYFSLTRGMKANEIRALAAEIVTARPSKIIFIDHVPHPKDLLLELVKRYRGHVVPPLYFHVYGDFTLFTGAWKSLETEFRGLKIAFICASSRQQTLVSRFLVSPVGSVFRCPFPNDSRQYYFAPDEGRELRQDVGIGPDEKVVLYTGRLSLQKNLIRLTREVASLREKLGVMPWFLIAGAFDDLGAPFFGIGLAQGYYFQAWNGSLCSLPREARARIRYVGERGPGMLNALYNAADVYASVSAHHDEDYGMSPAEALCTGCPVVLSDWGGYASFKELRAERSDWSEIDGCDLVHVSIGKRGLLMSSEDFSKPMVARLTASAPLTANAPLAASARKGIRERRAEFYTEKLSIPAATEALREIHARPLEPFAGFGWRMEKHADSQWQRTAFPEGPRKNSFYEEIYGAYVGSDAGS